MKKIGVIFDLDGTLWDVTETTWFSANEIVKKHGLTEIDIKQIRNAFGQPKEGSAKIFFPNLPAKRSVPLVEEIISSNIDNLFYMGGKLYSGITEVLKELKKQYSLFIVTNSPFRRYAEAFMHYSKTREYFTQYYSAGELGVSKAQAIKKIVDDYDLPGAVYVGDTVLDAEAAKEAGVGFIYAEYGFGSVDADCSIASLFELPKAVDSVIKAGETDE